MRIQRSRFRQPGDVFDWLSGFINFERGQGSKNLSSKAFRLDRMEVLVGLAGHPEKSAPLIHIAGSKGKGSVTAMTASILEKHGFKTARYTSPHVSDHRERISRGDSSFFEDGVYLEAGHELRDMVARLESGGGSEASLFDSSGAGEGPTFFELLTLYFFLCARGASCDAMAVETGMGGRLDATNIVDPLVSIITPIELEHTEYLGTTLEAIAAEKGGIIKAGRPLILSRQKAEALGMIRNIAAERNAPCIYVPDHAEIGSPVMRPAEGGGPCGMNFSLTISRPGKDDGAAERERYPITLPLLGNIQCENAAAALLGTMTAFPEIKKEAVLRGLGEVRLPARFEQLSADPPFIIDGAHTPESIRHCTDTFRAVFGEGGILLFGCVEGKNAGAMADILLPHFSVIIISTPGSFKESDPAGVHAVFMNSTERKGQNILLMEETEKAVAEAIGLARTRGLPVLGAGSFYLAAEIRKYLPRDPFRRG